MPATDLPAKSVRLAELAADGRSAAYNRKTIHNPEILLRCSIGVPSQGPIFRLVSGKGSVTTIAAFAQSRGAGRGAREGNSPRRWRARAAAGRARAGLRRC